MFLLISLLLTVSTNNLFANTISCQLVGGAPSLFLLKNFTFTEKENGASSDFSLNTTKGVFNYADVECKNENVPDSVYSCEHDKFVMIMMLDEKPLKAVINPFVYSGVEYGPFFYICK
jgi:hypothetical protein